MGYPAAALACPAVHWHNTSTAARAARSRVVLGFVITSSGWRMGRRRINPAQRPGQPVEEVFQFVAEVVVGIGIHRTSSNLSGPKPLSPGRLTMQTVNVFDREATVDGDRPARRDSSGRTTSGAGRVCRNVAPARPRRA
jgi:hypothetical protein